METTNLRKPEGRRRQMVTRPGPPGIAQAITKTREATGLRLPGKFFPFSVGLPPNVKLVVLRLTT